MHTPAVLIGARGRAFWLTVMFAAHVHQDHVITIVFLLNGAHLP